MRILFSILFGALGAIVGGFLSQYLEDEPAGWKSGVAWRGGLVGAAWGVIAGVHAGTLVGARDIIRGFWFAAPPALTLAALAAFGAAVRSRSRRSDAATSRTAPRAIATIAAVLGIVVMLCFFLGVTSAETGLDFAAAQAGLPSEAEQAEMGFRMFVAAFAGMAGAFLLFVLRREFASLLVGSALGQFAGGAFLSYLTGRRLLHPALQSGLATAAGGLCTAFEWGLVGAAFGAIVPSLFAVVWLLIPDIGRMQDVLPKDELEDELSVNRGVKFARSVGSFGKLADDMGPLPVIGIAAGLFAFVGCVLGFMFGPYFGEAAWQSLQAAF